MTVGGTKSPDAAWLRPAAEAVGALADAHCAPGCHAYHAAWPLLRLYGVLPAVARDHAALLAALREQAEAGAARLLVTGAADFGILAYVIAAYAEVGRRAEVTVVDRCETPLVLNRRYGAEHGWEVTTATDDVRTFAGRDFDLVVAHNFLNFFAAAERVDVVDGWRRALRPGGAALVFANLKPAAPAHAPRFGVDGRERLVARMLTARRTSPHRDLIGEAELAACVRAYAEARRSHHLRDRDELCAPFHRAGLAIERIVAGERVAAGVVSDWEGMRVRLLARRIAT